MLSIPVQKRTAPTQLLQLAKSEAQKILMNTRGVDFVMICSSDGFELATVSHKNYPNTTKLAAMVMVTLSNRDVLLGQLLYSLKKASQVIAEADRE